MSQELTQLGETKSTGAFRTGPLRVSAVLVSLALTGAIWWATRAPEPAGPVQTQTLTPVPKAASPAQAVQSENPAAEETKAPGTISDAELSRRMVGRWETDRGGKRELVVYEDGTAHMNVTITTYHKMLFGEQVAFDGTWSIQDGQLHFETTGGKPDWSVKAVTSVYGKSRVQPILKLTEDELVLKDVEEGEPNHEYRRVAD